MAEEPPNRWDYNILKLGAAFSRKVRPKRAYPSTYSIACNADFNGQHAPGQPAGDLKAALGKILVGKPRPDLPRRAGGWLPMVPQAEARQGRASHRPKPLLGYMWDVAPETRPKTLSRQPAKG